MPRAQAVVTHRGGSSGQVNVNMNMNRKQTTPSSHSKNSLSKICSKGWVALHGNTYTICAKNFQGLGPKRPESWIENWLYMNVKMNMNVSSLETLPPPGGGSSGLGGHGGGLAAARGPPQAPPCIFKLV